MYSLSHIPPASKIPVFVFISPTHLHEMENKHETCDGATKKYEQDIPVFFCFEKDKKRNNERAKKEEKVLIYSMLVGGVCVMLESVAAQNVFHHPK